MRKDASFVNANALPTTKFGEFEAEPAFADASFGDYADDPTVALHCICEFALECGKFVTASDERTQTPATSESVARRRVQSPLQFEDLYGSCDAANFLQAKGTDFDKLSRGRVGILRDEDAAAIRHLLHSTREMHIYAGRVIRLIDGVLDNLNDNFTRMKADADLQSRIVELADRVLHG